MGLFCKEKVIWEIHLWDFLAHLNHICFWSNTPPPILIGHKLPCRTNHAGDLVQAGGRPRQAGSVVNRQHAGGAPLLPLLSQGIRVQSIVHSTARSPGLSHSRAHDDVRELLSALLTLCEGTPPLDQQIPLTKGPVMWELWRIPCC